MKSIKLKTLTAVAILCFFQNSFGQNSVEVTLEKPSVGLVLSGGGAKGFSYVGLLKVLEEVNMPIDYIGGTSIGAVVGALFAAGYSAETIEQLIRQQDWDALINDKLERQYISFEEKLFSEKYYFTIPIEESGITLSNAFTGSFNIDLMLNNLFSQVAHITDFKQLPIPFLCISTNLLTGEQIVIDSGNLARATRASMAIPGYFPPIQYQGNFMIDGGVVNNYPAEQIKELGIDIIIGGDVQSGLRKDIDELNSVPAILDQVLTFNRIEANKKGWALTDHYVHIPMPYGMLDFSEYDSIIAIGERVAREHYNELKAIADSVNELRSSFSERNSNTQPIDSLIIQKIRLQGMKWQQRERFIGYFEGIDLGKTSIFEIEERMKLLNGSRSFQELHYELVSETPNQAILDIYASASNKGSLSAGIHSDNVYHGSLLVNMTLRNIRGTRTKFFTDFVLGQNPRLNSMLIVNNGFKPGIGGESDFYSITFPLFNKDKKVNTWSFEAIKASVFMPITVRNNFFFRTGFQYELFRFSQNVVVDSITEENIELNDYGNLFMEVRYDNRDKVNFTTKGRVVEVKLMHVLPFSSEWKNFISNSTILSFKYNANVSLAEKWVVSPCVYAGYTFVKEDPSISPYIGGLKGNVYPVQHMFGFGGLNSNNYVENHQPFTGLRYIERMGIYAGKVSLKVQYNFYPDLYFSILGDVGINEFNLDNIIADNILLGGGLKVGYDSFIGPVEVAFMKSNISSKPTVFLNLGYWF